MKHKSEGEKYVSYAHCKEKLFKRQLASCSSKPFQGLGGGWYLSDQSKDPSSCLHISESSDIDRFL